MASDNKVPPVTWLPVVGLAWLVPGGGHLLLQRRSRGLILFFTIMVTFVAGLLMRGAMFQWKTGDLFTTLIYCGGYIADLSSGLLYLFTVWMGYVQEDVAGHVHDYGTKFLVAAGLMNVLAMVDAYEIATRKKD